MAAVYQIGDRWRADWIDKAGARHRLRFNTETEARDHIANGARSIPAPYTGEVCLYVIQRGDNGPIKIGISRRLKERIATLQNGNAEKLKVLQVYKMSDVEKAIHRELAKVAKLEGEWFPAELIGLIGRFFGTK
jgi:predicted GIY-YIG superfamily endonuclease